MPETDELKIFEADPKRVVSVTVEELRDLAYAASRTPEMRISIAELTAHERTCHMLECHEWQDEWEPYGIYCSECEAFVPDWNSKNNTHVPKYCPNCGARVVSGNE